MPIDLLCPDGYTFRQGNKPYHLKSCLDELCILDNMSNVVRRKPVYAERRQNWIFASLLCLNISSWFKRVQIRLSHEPFFDFFIFQTFEFAQDSFWPDYQQIYNWYTRSWPFLTPCMLDYVAHAFAVVFRLVFKINFFQKIRFGPRTEPTFCRSWCWSWSGLNCLQRLKADDKSCRQ